MIFFCDEGVLQFDARRCCQCGACLAACADGALSRGRGRDGRFEIAWDGGACTGCNRCVEVCPAPALPERRWTEASWNTIRAVYVGHARDETRRRTSSSGGVARTLVEAALERRLVDRAYCLLRDDEYPWARGEYLERGADPSLIANSTYRPVPVLENCRPLSGGTKLAVVGLNCQLLAIERFYERSGVDIFGIGILCKQQKHEGFTRFIRRRLGLDGSEDEPPEYRGAGWPGEMSIGGRTIDWADAAALPFGKGLWMLPACRFCANAFGATADVTIADPWSIVSAGEAGGGLSLVVVRTERGERLIEAGMDRMCLTRSDIDAVKVSVVWANLRKKLAAIPVRMGAERNRTLAARLRFGDVMRSRYERLLERVLPPEMVLRLLSHLPFFDAW